jgi:hypothetical protein
MTPLPGAVSQPTSEERAQAIRLAENSCESCDFVAWSNEKERQLELLPRDGGGWRVMCGFCATLERCKPRKRKAAR